ncbi:MAG TPA: BTAD domain-containing putative transcriptional regulator [Acidimicrobiia bacterium]|nr:BTAD domain-containing putative transcriptional regulator [Acidimicrobiia bacterium]
MDASERLKIRVLGPVRAAVDDRPINLGGARQKAMLAFLACHPARVVSVSSLIDAIWGEAPPESANAVQVSINRLRQAMGEARDVLITDPPGYRLALDGDAIDAARFVTLFELSKSAGSRRRLLLEECLSLWEGEAFADIPDVPFVAGEKTRLQELRLAATEDRIELDLASSRHQNLTAELEALVQAEPYREALWRFLIVALYRSDRQADALAAFHRVRQILLEDLGLDPGPALVALEDAVLRQDPSLDPPVALEAAQRLKEPPSELMGRQDELATLCDQTRRHRLVTVVGPGGVGKTRLALEVAHDLVDQFQGGVTFVELADLKDPSLVMAEIARARGAGGGHDPLADLVTNLGDLPTLLVLDNFEQVSKASPELARLLEMTRTTHLLVTSRAPMHLVAEHLFQLSPLPPDQGSALFIARAEAVCSNRPDDETAIAISEQLDGLPLAIELAAAKCRHMSAADLLARLTDRFETLSEGAHDLPDRHRALRATLDWSAELLGNYARDVLVRISVFASPFDLDAAKAVADGGTDLVKPIGELVDANLLTAEDGRYRMLETVREYAYSHLVGTGQAESMAARHASWIIARCKIAESDLHSAHEMAARSELSGFLPDMRSAIDYLLENHRHEEVAEMLLATSLMWYHEGLLSELARYLELASEGSITGAIEAEATTMRGVFAKLSGDNDRGVPLIMEGVERLRRLSPNSVKLVNGLCHLAAFRAEIGDATAFEAADEALSVAERSGDPGSVVMALDLGSYVAGVLNSLDRALMAAEQSVEAGRRLDSPQLANSLARMAVALEAIGRHDQAVAAAEEALALAESGRSAAQLAEVRLNVAPMIASSNRAMAADSLTKSVAAWVAMGLVPSALDAASKLATLIAKQLPTEAAMMVGAIDFHSGARTEPTLKSELVALLGEHNFEVSYNTGRRLDMDRLSRLAAEATDKVKVSSLGS